MAITKGGICFQFYDSAYWSFFNTAYPIFQNAFPNWKATFYMDNWASTSGTIQAQMLAAQAAGIEIGNSTDQITSSYLVSNTEQQYYDNLVAANAADMVAGGIISPTSFALNTGEAPRSLINLILAQGGDTVLVFKKTGGIFTNPQEANGYYKNLYSQGGGAVGRVDANIDIQRYCYDENFFIDQLDYCKANNDVVIWAGHALQPVANQALSALYSTIQKLSRYCVCNGMTFYTVNDLINEGFVGVERTIPYVSLIIITGTQSSGNNLTATYTYAQETDVAQSGTTFQWYRADDANGTNAAAIAGATALVYTLTGSDISKYVRIGIIPKAVGGQTGYETFSKWLAIS